MYEGFRGNPVLLDRSVFAEAMGLTGDIGCRAMFGSHSENILKVRVDDVGILLDVDTKSDFEKLQQAYERGALQSTLLEAADLEGREEAPSAERRQLVVVGREGVARALVKIGRLLNYTVTVVDPLLPIRELPEADQILHALDFSRLPGSAEKYVVVASRGRFDEEAIEQALQADAAYIALVSNPKRVQEILASLKSRGISAEKLARVRAPAGLDIGAESPEEIALSVIAEIVSQRRGRR
jgi:xanthine/CO dehydrogenase XdhC/CoxF family maturation factor